MYPRFSQELDNCTLAKTGKGFHYIFVRPEGCTHTYKGRAYYRSNCSNEKLCMDCITVTGNNGTRGCLNVYPSAGKEWIRSIHEYPPQVMSKGLYDFLDNLYYKGPRQRQQVQQRVPKMMRLESETANAVESFDASMCNPCVKDWTKYLASLSGCPLKCIKWTSHDPLTNETKGRIVWSGRKCLANDQHIAEHDNATLTITSNGGCRYFCFSAQCRGRKEFPPYSYRDT